MTDGDTSPLESSQLDEDLRSDLWGLVHNFRTKADIFPEGEANRLGHHCADELEDVLRDHEVER